MRIFYSKIRSILVFNFLLFLGLSAAADVAITMPTGGQNISADKSIGGPSTAYTALGNIVISDVLANDFTVGTNQTITFAIPSDWRIVGSGVTVTPTGSRLSAATISSISTTSVTVSFTVTGASGTGNSLTIAGIMVRSQTGPLTSVQNITKTSSTNVIPGLADGTVVASLSKVAGAFPKW